MSLLSNLNSKARLVLQRTILFVFSVLTMQSYNFLHIYQCLCATKCLFSKIFFISLDVSH